MLSSENTWRILSLRKKNQKLHIPLILISCCPFDYHWSWFFKSSCPLLYTNARSFCVCSSKPNLQMVRYYWGDETEFNEFIPDSGTSKHTISPIMLLIIIPATGFDNGAHPQLLFACIDKSDMKLIGMKRKKNSQFYEQHRNVQIRRRWTNIQKQKVQNSVVLCKSEMG